MKRRTAVKRLSDLMDAHPWARYATAAAFMGGIAARDGYVLAAYLPSSTGAWIAFLVGTALAITLAALAVLWTPATAAEVKSRPDVVALTVLLLVLILFGFYEGLGITRAGSVNLAAENPLVRSFALGAALGAVALFGLGSHRAARSAQRRTARTQMVLPDQ